MGLVCLSTVVLLKEDDSSVVDGLTTLQGREGKCVLAINMQIELQQERDDDDEEEEGEEGLLGTD